MVRRWTPLQRLCTSSEMLYESYSKSKMSKIGDFVKVTPPGKYMVEQAFVMLTLRVWQWL